MGIGAWKARMTDGFRATGSCFVVVCGLGNEGMKMQEFKTIYSSCSVDWSLFLGSAKAGAAVGSKSSHVLYTVIEELVRSSDIPTPLLS